MGVIYKLIRRPHTKLNFREHAHFRYEQDCNSPDSELMFVMEFMNNYDHTRQCMW